VVLGLAGLGEGHGGEVKQWKRREGKGRKRKNSTELYGGPQVATFVQRPGTDTTTTLQPHKKCSVFCLHLSVFFVIIIIVILLLIIVHNDHRWPAMMVFNLSGSLPLFEFVSVSHCMSFH